MKVQVVRSKVSLGRNNRAGSSLAEAAVAIVLIVGATLVASELIVNSGFVMFFKTKLTHVNYLAADYAAAHGGDTNLQEETTDFVLNAMSNMGIKPNRLVVDVQQISLREDAAFRVTVSNEFPLFGAPYGLPANIKLSDSEVTKL